jgi:hypothetical protein
MLEIVQAGGLAGRAISLFVLVAPSDAPFFEGGQDRTARQPNYPVKDAAR